MSANEPPTRTQDMSLVKQALAEIRDLRQRLAAQQALASEPIAVVGMGCRLPGGVESPRDFWKLLRDGGQPIATVPVERWDAEAMFDSDPDAPGKTYCKVGAFVGGVAEFDPYFFGIPPREAQSMDPQQRLLMEVAWQTLEHAGQDPSGLRGSDTGVFVGIGSFDYAILEARSLAARDIDAYLGSGIAHSVAAGRLSYFFGFQGPCLAVDTACSSSLVAVHQACASLRARECRMALAGGANLMLAPDQTITFSRARMLSVSGRCKTFDAGADGYVRGEGVALVALKRLSDAIVDGDRVHAVIRGSAVNQDGRSTGLTVPNGPAQTAVITQAVKAAGLTAADVRYVEAHGTATPLGDPIEVQALAAALGAGRTAGDPLLIGSVKTNIGHLESCAGVAGLIKVVLAMSEGEIPAHVGFETPSPHIDWAQLPVTVTTERRQWPQGRRIAGVSSFGFSGTNAHVIVEEAPNIAESAGDAAVVDRPAHVLTLSAKSEVALQALAQKYRECLGYQPKDQVGDVCHTAATGRAHFAHRLAIVGRTRDELVAGLTRFAGGEKPAIGALGQSRGIPEIAFLFTGQGSQYIGMGRELYESEPVFRGVVDRCADALAGLLERDLREVMFTESAGALDQTGYTQPALYALEVGLAQLWKSWGIEPTVVLGHSVGEYAAACVAGVFEVEEGARLIAERGRQMQQLPGSGAMLAVQGDSHALGQQLGQLLRGNEERVSVAAHNAPGSVVLSGESAVLDKLAQVLDGQGFLIHRLQVSHGFHSAQMQPMLTGFEQYAQGVAHRAPQVSWVSNLTGDVLQWDQWSGKMGQYWRRHVREPVQFERGVKAAQQQGAEVFIEVGPHPVLSGLGRATLKSPGVGWLPSLQRGRGAWDTLLPSLADIYVRGGTVDWTGFDRPYSRATVSLPTYPFQRQRYWIGGAVGVAGADGTVGLVGVAGTAGASGSVEPVSSRVTSAVGVTTADGALESQSIWARATVGGRRQAQYAPVDLAIESFPAKWRFLEKLSAAYMLTALRSLGLFVRPGESHTPCSLVTAAGIQTVYLKLMERWLRRLSDAGVLEVRGDTFVAVAPLPAEPIEPLIETARQVFADYPELFAYVSLCGRELPDVLTGRQSALETLFPEGSSDIADGLYRGSLVAKYFNEIVRAVVQSIAVRSRALAFLEIGGGTGGTTSLLLPELPAERTRYVFTDVSKLFLSKAREQFASYGFVEYGILDIEGSPDAQGYPAGSFDVVVAANVLHATGDLAATLRKARALLASDGVLIMLETTDHPIWLDISTGLIEGWQKFEDPLRSSHPLLDPEQWAALLSDCGFVAAEAFPAKGARTELLGQHVIVARAPHLATGARLLVRSVADGEPRANTSTSGRAPVEQPEALRARITAALPQGREDILTDLVCREVGDVLGTDAEHRPQGGQRLHEFGVDSLMAVELRNRLARRLALTRKLTATLIFDYPTPRAIARYLADEALGFGTSAASIERPAAAEHDAYPAIDPAALEQMGDAEAEALLAERLRQL